MPALAVAAIALAAAAAGAFLLLLRAVLGAPTHDEKDAS